jgi:hypothetical protein
VKKECAGDLLHNRRPNYDGKGLELSDSAFVNYLRRFLVRLYAIAENMLGFSWDVGGWAMRPGMEIKKEFTASLVARFETDTAIDCAFRCICSEGGDMKLSASKHR